jgi:uncharacterized protein YkwD
MVPRRVGVLIAVATANVLTFSAPAPVPTTAYAPRPALASPGHVHLQTDRARADSAVYRHVLPSVRVSTGWTGRVRGCRPGTISTASLRATRDLVNTYRSLAGVRPIWFGGKLSGQAQRAALMMEAARRLSHHPGRRWPCWTRAGANGAAKSDLAYLSSGRLAIPAYMDDKGRYNRDVGHRRWLLDPRQTRMGLGQTRHANALFVLHTSSWSWPSGRSPYVAWPSAGYFPVALEPRGRWSLSSPLRSVDLRQARVTVTGPDGRRLALRGVYRQRDVLTWDLEKAIGRGAGADRTYTVRVTGIVRSKRAAAPLTYRVTMVPLRPLRTTELPTVNGDPSVRVTGQQRLVADPGSWTPTREVGRYAYQWLRDGVPIVGATGPSYQPTTADQGRRITVRVTAVPRSGYYRKGAAVSRAG